MTEGQSASARPFTRRTGRVPRRGPSEGVGDQSSMAGDRMAHARTEHPGPGTVAARGGDRSSPDIGDRSRTSRGPVPDGPVGHENGLLAKQQVTAPRWAETTVLHRA